MELDRKRCGTSAYTSKSPFNLHYANVEQLLVFQHEPLAHIKQQPIKGPNMISDKKFNQEHKRSYLYKKSNKERETLMNHLNKRHPLNTRFLTWDIYLLCMFIVVLFI